MNRLLEPLCDESEGGSAPRRRNLTESMIAGRRRPADGTSESATKDSGSSEGRGARAERGKADEEAKPAAPRRRRRPSPRTRREDETAAQPEEEREEGASDEEGAGTTVATVEAAMRRTAEVSEAPPVAAPTTEAPEDLQSLNREIGALRGLIEEQRATLAELRAGLLMLGRQVDRSGYRPRLGVFIDVPNLIYGFEGDRQVHMGKLLDLLREGRQLVRATAYSPVSDDPREPLEQQKFVAPFVAYDYRIVTKPLKRFADGSIKGNFDVEMAIDMLSMADRVDVVAIVSGDADFARAVEAVQARGVRVEVIAFAGSTSLEMRALADHYLELSTVLEQIT